VTYISQTFTIHHIDQHLVGRRRPTVHHFRLELPHLDMQQFQFWNWSRLELELVHI